MSSYVEDTFSLTLKTPASGLIKGVESRVSTAPGQSSLGWLGSRGQGLLCLGHAAGGCAS